MKSKGASKDGLACFIDFAYTLTNLRLVNSFLDQLDIGEKSTSGLTRNLIYHQIS